MRILVTGDNGYIGFPTIIELINNTGHTIIGVDNDFRTEWVEKVTGKLFYPETQNLHSDGRYIHIKGDLTDASFVNEILAIHKPDCIIHLASQPSMPYSQINGERAAFSQINNLSMLLNLLWGAKCIVPKCRFVVTTTTGIPGQMYDWIPEEPVINAAGSWYHVSRGFDSANMALAARQWGVTILELRTAIVYGIQTGAMREYGLQTRFDTDYYFGTALNRFVQAGIDGKEITVYGKGHQTKPFISLEDTVHSLVNAIHYDVPPGHYIFNQTTESVAIVELAKMIHKHTNAPIIHLDNPRKENEDFQMTFDNERFLHLLGREPVRMESEIKCMIEHINGRSYAEEGNSFSVDDCSGLGGTWSADSDSE